VAQACAKIIEQLSLDGYHIFSDGAVVADPKSEEQVYVQPLDREVVRQLIDFVHHNEVNLDLYSATHFYAERETWATDIRRKFFGLVPTIVDFNQILQRETLIKGTLVVSSTEEKAIVASLQNRFKNVLSFSLTKTPAYPEVDFINVIDPGVSKGKALEALASHLGIPLPQVAAIGDGGNDVSLLSRAGLAIAMGNATEELKEVADCVTDDVDHNGAATAIKKFLLS
jgi:Cof subfamily protein (haloacid dehalogenase superfamily)